MSLRGVLLCNIGTPKSYAVEDVASYLREFLMDPDVITLPWIVRYPLVNWIIVPKRAAQSAHNYKSIWTPQGSPLMVNMQNLLKNLQSHLGAGFSVKIGMSYGDLSVERALNEFQHEKVSEVILLPLYPQYAQVTTGSTFKNVKKLMKKNHYDFSVRNISSFYNNKKFITGTAEVARQALAGKKVDHYLMTFHGLPESQVRKVDGCLSTPNCCAQPLACQKNCYRAQCVATAESIAKELGLAREQWSLSFQSRLGRAAWIKPYTESTLKELGEKGVKNLAVLSPSFVADCVETLEELGIQGQATFKNAGGQEFHLVPCLNERTDYLETLLV